jgi:hypothetical protein
MRVARVISARGARLCCQSLTLMETTGDRRAFERLGRRSDDCGGQGSDGGGAAD